MIREFGHSRKGNAQPEDYYEDEKKDKFIAAEKNVTLFASYRAVSVKMNGDRIESIVIKHIETGEEQCLKALLFSDCTGDGTIGYLAGAIIKWDVKHAVSLERNWLRRLLTR